MVRGIGSNVVDGPVLRRAPPIDPPGTEENGSFLPDGSSRTRFPAKTPCLNFGETFVSRPKLNLERVSPALIVSHFVTLG